MKQSIFSHRPYNLSLFALAALNLAFAFFLFFNSAIADGEPFAPEIAVVNNPNPQERLNLREQPSEAAASLGKYYNGVAVQVDENLNNGWVHVTIGNGEGIKTINYGLSSSVAFVLFYVLVDEGKVYYLPIQDYFIANPSLFERLEKNGATLNVHIPLDNVVSDNDFDLQQIAKSVYVGGPSRELHKA